LIEPGVSSLFNRRTNQKIANTISKSAAKPPTAPPIIAPRLELGFDEGKGEGGMVFLGSGIVVVTGSVSVSIKVFEVPVSVAGSSTVRGMVAVMNCAGRSVSTVKDTL
jgi:hypothetical protein